MIRVVGSQQAVELLLTRLILLLVQAASRKLGPHSLIPAQPQLGPGQACNRVRGQTFIDEPSPTVAMVAALGE